MAASEKDWWDKTEILTKVAGTIIIPFAVVWVTNSWRAEKETAANSAAYTSLARIIATTTKARDRDGDGVYESGKSLDNWVARTLANPTSPPALDGAALKDLEGRIESGELFYPSTEQFVESVLGPYLEGGGMQGRRPQFPDLDFNERNEPFAPVPFPPAEGRD